MAIGVAVPGFLLVSCGYVGDPQPPALNIPVAVKDLRAVERGADIVVRFTIPELSTEGLVLKRLGGVDLRAGAGPPGDFNIDAWASAARRFPAGREAPGEAEVRISVSEFVGREIVVGVRTAGPKGKLSAWSNLVVLTVVPPLAPPAGLAADSAPDGVVLAWKGEPGQTYRVFRDGQPVGISPAETYRDAAADLGRRYSYAVQALRKAGDAEAESEISPAVDITPRDRFPPAAPAGLTVLAGTGSIELSWDSNTESDLKGYAVYRAAGDGDFERTGELVAAPSFSDRRVESGKRYRYLVTALDLRNNESARSEVKEIIMP